MRELFFNFFIDLDSLNNYYYRYYGLYLVGIKRLCLRFIMLLSLTSAYCCLSVCLLLLDLDLPRCTPYWSVLYYINTSRCSYITVSLFAHNLYCAISDSTRKQDMSLFGSSRICAWNCTYYTLLIIIIKQSPSLDYSILVSCFFTNFTV